MGLFRGEVDESGKDEGKFAPTTQDISQIESKLDALHQRIALLEAGANPSLPSNSIALNSESDKEAVDSMISTSLPTDPGFSKSEEAVSTINKALVSHVAKEASRLSRDASIADASPTIAPPQDSTNKASGGSSSVYVVKKGDNLSKISQRVYGTPNKWMVIYNANKSQIPNKNNLKVGTKLTIPAQK